MNGSISFKVENVQQLKGLDNNITLVLNASIKIVKKLLVFLLLILHLEQKEKYKCDILVLYNLF